MPKITAFVELENFLKKTKRLYELAEKKKAPNLVSFKRIDYSTDHLDSLYKWNYATTILPDNCFRKSFPKRFRKKEGYDASSLKVEETWIITKNNFFPLLNELFWKQNDFWFHFLTQSMYLFHPVREFGDGGKEYYRPTKILELLIDNQDIEKNLREAILRAELWDFMCYVLQKLRYKCSICKKMTNCGEENLLYFYEELSDNLKCKDQLKSMFNALILGKLIILEGNLIRANQELLKFYPDINNPQFMAFDKIRRFWDYQSAYNIKEKSLQSILDSKAVDYGKLLKIIDKDISELKNIKDIKKIEEILDRAASLFPVIRESLAHREEYKVVEDKAIIKLKSKLSKELNKEYAYNLLRLCNTEEDIDSFKKCCQTIQGILDWTIPGDYIIMSLKSFLRSLSSISFRLDNSPKKVIEIAKRFAKLEREIEQRKFDNPDDQGIFEWYVSEKIQEQHKKFDLEKAMKYHYSTTHIIPTVATALNIRNSKPDKSLYHKRVANEISRKVGRNFENTILIFIDGLGIKQYEYFRKTLSKNALSRIANSGILLPVRSVFPSETYCSLYSIFAGTEPTEHLIVGKRFCVNEKGKLRQIDLGNEEGVKIIKNKIKPTFLKKCSNNGLRVGFISQVEDKSRFGKDILLKGIKGDKAEFIYKPRLGEIFKSAANFVYRCLEKKERFVLQVYIDEADSKWHDDGPYSTRIMEEISDKIKQFLDYIKMAGHEYKIPSTLLAVFSDHGMVQVAPDILVQDFKDLDIAETKGDVIFDTGMRYLSIYFNPSRKRIARNVAKKINNELNTIVKAQSVWNDHDTFPDLFIYPKDNMKLCRRVPKEEKSPLFQHFGVHGGASFDEIFAILILTSLNKLIET